MVVRRRLPAPALRAGPAGGAGVALAFPPARVPRQLQHGCQHRVGRQRSGPFSAATMTTETMSAAAPAWSAIEAGEGRPLVLLHGLGLGGFAWSPVLERLAATRRAIALALPRFGAPPPPSSGAHPPAA